MYNVQTDSIQVNILYKVLGDKSVIYNEIEYFTGQFFRGIKGVSNFVYDGIGSELVTEISEISGGALVFEQTVEEREFPFEETGVKGMAVIFELNDSEKIVQEVTKLTGMSITLVDFPFYANEITETRL